MTPQQCEEWVAEFLERRENGEGIDCETFLAERAPGDERLRRALQSALALEDDLPSPFTVAGERIGPFEIAGTLGHGASGKVVVASDLRVPGAPAVALKLLHPALALDPRARERFRRECESLRSISHPCVVKVLDVGEADGMLYLALELAEGENLEQRVPAGPLVDLAAVRAAVRLVATLARGVAQVHAHGLVHRDIKPSNVVLRPEGTPVLIDFGLVGVSSAATLTATGDVLGTPQFMAPEQARGADVDARADVFALGAVLLRLLTGALPHGSTSTLATLEEARRESLPSLRSLSPALPRELDRIVYRATAFDRECRTASAEELALDLERFLDGEAVRAVGPTLRERWCRLRREQPVAVACALTAVVVAAIGATGFAWHRGEPAIALPPAAESAQAVRTSQAVQAARVTLHRALVSALDGEPARARELLDGVPVNTADRDLYDWWLRGAPADEPGPAGDTAAALAARARGDHVLAVECAERATRSGEDPALALVTLARIAEEREDWAAVERELAQLERLLPECGWVHRQRGRAARERDDSVLAAEQFQRATERFPEDAMLWRDLAIARHRSGDAPGALAAARQAVHCAREQDADSVIAELLLVYGILLDQHGQYVEAEPLFREILGKRPKLASAHFHLAMNLDWQHRFPEAEQEYSSTIECDPAHARADIALAWLYSGSDWSCERCRAYFADDTELRDDELAREYALSGATKDRGRDRGTAMTAAAVLRRVGAEEEGLERFQRLLDESTEDAQIVSLQRALRALRD